MKRQNPGGNGVLVQSKSDNLIVPTTPASEQYLEARSLPSLTDLIEFLERIQRLHPIIRRTAIRLYTKFTGIDQQHLDRIAKIRSDLGGGVR